MRNVSSGTIDYYAEDMLGSSRTIVQAGQTSPCYDADFYPFGGERDVVATCSQNYKFEGKERDTETGNDDFGARYYNSRLGRWLSSDWSSVPAPVPYANLTNPQTLNLYAIVSDDPESFADLDGHDREVSPAVLQPDNVIEMLEGCGTNCAFAIQEEVKCDEDPTGCAIAKDEQQQAQTADPSWYSKNMPFCICDDYNVDMKSHGSPHIDRVDKHGKLVGRYDVNGKPIPHKGKQPGPIPNSDKGKFGKALDELREKTGWQPPAGQEEQNGANSKMDPIAPGVPVLVKPDIAIMRTPQIPGTTDVGVDTDIPIDLNIPLFDLPL